MKKNKNLEDQIESVINNLQKETAFDNKYESRRLSERMKETNTPGLCITVINDGNIAWTKGFGCKEFQKNDSVGRDTMFQAGSISKPIFALAVMKLKEKGLVDLDEDVNNYLKSWKIPKIGSWQPKITLRQLLSHTGGLTVHGFLGYQKNEDLPTIKQILNGEYPANSAKVEVNVIPGITRRYSGGGTTAAQLAIEDLLQKPFAQIMEEELFKPLNLINSTYDQYLTDFESNRTAGAHPYKNRLIPGKNHIYPEMAAAGLWTTTEDLANIALEIQKAVKGKSDFISQSTILEMLTPQIVDKTMGIGFFLTGEGKNIRFKHDGWDEGFVAQMIAYKNIGKGIVVLINSNEGYDIMDEIIRATALEYKWPGFFPKKQKTLKLDKTELEKFAGQYKTEGIDAEISAHKSGLMLKINHQESILFKADSKNTFSSELMNVSLEFVLNRKKESIQMNLMQCDTTVELKKILDKK